MGQRRPGRRRARRHRIWWIWLGYWAALIAVTHVPPPEGFSLPGTHSDKLIHFVLYAGLAILGGYSHRLRYRSSSTAVLVTWAMIYCVYAAADEWTQGLVGRTPSVLDWLADAVGVVSGTALWLLVRSPRGHGDTASRPATKRVL